MSKSISKTGIDLISSFEGIRLNAYDDFLNGVCRHEQDARLEATRLRFLNGVCRHELLGSDEDCVIDFLNGVCRHERVASAHKLKLIFLNGVCRHEHCYGENCK